VSRCVRPLAVTAAGSVAFALSAASGNGLELGWLPAVLLGASWPDGGTGLIRACIRQRERKEEA
jgi:hypothetical protein